MSSKATRKDLLAQIESLTQALKQERADAINARQRFAQEKQSLIAYTESQLTLKILPLLDDLQRAFASVPETIAKDAWVKGVLKIQKLLLEKYMKELHLEVIKTKNQLFDPQTMEALTVVKNKQKQSGLVVEEITRGYLYQAVVLRPAQVKVVQN